MPGRLRRILPGVSRDARTRWLVTGGLAVVDAVWAIASGRRFIIPWAILAFVTVMIAEAAVCYRRWKVRDAEHIRHRFAHCCHTTAQLTVFLCAGLVLSDLHEVDGRNVAAWLRAANATTTLRTANRARA